MGLPDGIAPRNKWSHVPLLLSGLLRGSFGYLGYVEVVTRVITSISGYMSPD